MREFITCAKEYCSAFITNLSTRVASAFRIRLDAALDDGLKNLVFRAKYRRQRHFRVGSLSRK